MTGLQASIVWSQHRKRIVLNSRFSSGKIHYTDNRQLEFELQSMEHDSAVF